MTYFNNHIKFSRNMPPSNGIPLSLELMLQSLASSESFKKSPQKNWDSLCRLVPGTNAKQVLKQQ